MPDSTAAGLQVLAERTGRMVSLTPCVDGARLASVTCTPSKPATVLAALAALRGMVPSITDDVITDAHARILELGGPNSTDPQECKRIKLHHVSAVAAMPSMRWLVKGVLPRSGVVFLFAQPGSCKTFVALDMAMHVALGSAWCGRRVRQGPGLVFAGEGQRGLPQRVNAWRIGNRQTLDAIPVEIAFEAPAIATAGGQARMRDAIDSMQSPPVLVVVDTLAQALPGTDENSAQDVGPALHFLAALASERDLCVLVVHHERKATEVEGLNAMRGSSALAGAADAALRVRRTKTRITVEMTKQKDGEADGSLELRLELAGIGEDEDGEVQLVPYLRPATAPEQRAERGNDDATFRAKFAETFGSTGACAGDLDDVAESWGFTRRRSRELRLQAVGRGELVHKREGAAHRFRIGPRVLAIPPAPAGESANPVESLAATPTPRVRRGGEIPGQDSVSEPGAEVAQW